MSRTFKVKTDKPFPLVEVISRTTELSTYRPMAGRIFHPTYYFYNFSSLRGTEVTQEADGIEVRMTVLSNHHDISMGGYFLHLTAKLTGGEIYDEDDNACYPYFYDGNIYDYIAEDLSVVQVLLTRGEEVTMYGPFGEYPLQQPEVLSVLQGDGDTHSKMWRLEKLLKQPYETYFEQLRSY